MLDRPTPESLNLAAPPHQRAVGEARLAVKQRDGSTHIDRLFQRGCAKIRIPAQHGGEFQAVAINSSGGLTGGDDMRWHYQIGTGCHATITTQACERIYRSSGGAAQVKTVVEIEEQARLAWLPQETIAFDGSALDRSLDVHLHVNSEALIVEPIIFGRALMGERMSGGQLRDRWRVFRGDELLHAEEMRLDPLTGEHLTRRFIADGHGALATLLLVSPRAESMMGEVNALLPETGAVAFWNGKLLARLVAKDGYTLRQHLVPLLNLLNFGANLPKVWAL